MKLIVPTLLVLCFFAVGQGFATEPTSTDYLVWSAAIEMMPGSKVCIWHATEPSSRYERIGKPGWPGAEWEYGLAAAASNQAPAELQADRFGIDKPTVIPSFSAAQNERFSRYAAVTVQLLDRPLLKQIIGRRPKPTWLLSPGAIEGATAIYRLSMPAYSEDGRAAYFLCCQCSTYHGSLVLMTVLKDDQTGQWSLHRSQRKDYVHWKEVSYLIDEQE